MTDPSPSSRGRARPLGVVVAVVGVLLLLLIAVGRLPAVRGHSSGPGAAAPDLSRTTAGPDGGAPAASGRPPAVTTPLPPPGDQADEDPLPRVLLASSGGDHRWFLGLRGPGIRGYGIGHQGPEMPSDAYRLVSGFGMTPQLLAAFGPRAWVISAPPAPGGESPVFAIRLARNEIHDLWYPPGRTTLTPVPRLPAGVEPLVAAASPDGPVILAAAAAAEEPRRLLRLGVERWFEHPLADPAGVDPAVLAAEVPVALAVVRLPAPPAAPSPAPSPAPAPSPDGDEPAALPGDPPAAPREVETLALTMLLVAGPDGLAIDLVGTSGERSRAWTGRPTVAAAVLRDHRASAAPPASASDADATDPGPRPPFRAALVEVDRQPWLAVRRDGRIVLESLRHEPASDGPGRLRLAGPDGPRIEVDLAGAAGPWAVIGGDGVMVLEGDGLEEQETPIRVRAWTAGGTVDLEGPLAAVEVDPSVILRGPIIIGTGIFFAVIIAVLSSRPGARPAAIEGREATVGRRLSAAWIDALAPLVAAGLVFGWTPEVLIASLLLLHPAGFAPWLGFTLLWAFATAVGDLAGGRTPGRLVMRIRPVDAEGSTPSRTRLGLRFFIRTVSVGFPPLVMFWLAHARSRGLHDLAAGTWVVRTDRPAPKAEPSRG